MKIGRLVALIVIVMLFLILFGDRGFVGYRESRDRLEDLRAENLRRTADNDRLREDILLLRNDLDYIEALARRELGMIRDGETVFRFRDR